MVMGGDSCSEGCGFESQHHILDGHIFLIILFVGKDENKFKRGHLKNNDSCFGCPFSSIKFLPTRFSSSNLNLCRCVVNPAKLDHSENGCSFYFVQLIRNILTFFRSANSKTK